MNQQIGTDDSDTPYYKQIWFGITAIALVAIIASIIIANYAINNLEESRDRNIRQAILTTLNDESKVHSLLPDIVIFNMDSSKRRVLYDSLKNALLNYLYKRYSANVRDSDNYNSIQPYITCLDNLENKASITLTQSQLGELKKHIEFLASTVDRAVSMSKDNIDTELSKINTWVTIWIGVFGILGIFIPIVVNLKSFEVLQEIKKKAKEARKKSLNAEEIISRHKNDLDSISGLKEDLADVQNKIPNLIKKADEAHSSSTHAIQQSAVNNKMLIAYGAISKLRQLEDILLLNRASPILIIKSDLTSILNSLNSLKSNYNDDFYLDLVKEIRERLFVLAASTIVKNRKTTKALSEVVVFIDEMNGQISETLNEQLLQKFETMINFLVD